MTPHACGQFIKRFRGGTRDFAKDSDKALVRDLDENDDMWAGRPPRRRGAITTEHLVNAFRDDQAKRFKTGDAARTTLKDDVDVGRPIVEEFGKKPDPERLRPTHSWSFRLKIAERHHTSRCSEIVTVNRHIVKRPHATERLDRMPRFGPGFEVASEKPIDKLDHENGVDADPNHDQAPTYSLRFGPL